MDWIQKYLVNVIYICISTKGPSPSENKENFGIFITLATKDVGFVRTPSGGPHPTIFPHVSVFSNRERP